MALLVYLGDICVVFVYLDGKKNIFFGRCLSHAHAHVHKKTQKIKTILQYISFATYGSTL